MINFRATNKTNFYLFFSSVLFRQFLTVSHEVFKDSPACVFGVKHLLSFSHRRSVLRRESFIVHERFCVLSQHKSILKKKSLSIRRKNIQLQNRRKFSYYFFFKYLFHKTYLRFHHRRMDFNLKIPTLSITLVKDHHSES